MTNFKVKVQFAYQSKQKICLFLGFSINISIKVSKISKIRFQLLRLPESSFIFNSYKFCYIHRFSFIKQKVLSFFVNLIVIRFSIVTLRYLLINCVYELFTILYKHYNFQYLQFRIFIAISVRTDFCYLQSSTHLSAPLV